MPLRRVFHRLGTGLRGWRAGSHRRTQWLLVRYRRPPVLYEGPSYRKDLEGSPGRRSPGPSTAVPDLLSGQILQIPARTAKYTRRTWSGGNIAMFSQLLAD